MLLLKTTIFYLYLIIPTLLIRLRHILPSSTNIPSWFFDRQTLLTLCLFSPLVFLPQPFLVKQKVNQGSLLLARSCNCPRWILTQMGRGEMDFVADAHRGHARPKLQLRAPRKSTIMVSFQTTEEQRRIAQMMTVGVACQSHYRHTKASLLFILFGSSLLIVLSDAKWLSPWEYLKERPIFLQSLLQSEVRRGDGKCSICRGERGYLNVWIVSVGAWCAEGALW